MKKTTIVLLNPPTGLYVRDDRCQSSVASFMIAIPRPPHELLIMATVAERSGAVVHIRDYPIERKTNSDLARDVVALTPDITVINATIPTLSDDIACAVQIKTIRPDTLIILRCGMIEPIAAEVMQAHTALDIVCYNESDFLLQDILHKERAAIPGIVYRDAAGQTVKTERRPYGEPLDALPIVNRNLIHNERYVRPDTNKPLGMIEVSRGCPFSCIFCLTQANYGAKHRRRSVPSVITEIETCIRDHGIYDFHFKSDLFSFDKKWVEELCEAIITRGLPIRWFANSRVDTVDDTLCMLMKKAGCFALSFGVESGSQMILDKIDKRTTIAMIHNAFALCKKNGIRTYAYFMIGFPWDTEATVQETIQCACTIDPDYVDFFFPYVFYGSRLYDIVCSLGLYAAPSYAEMQKDSYVALQYRVPDLPAKRLEALRKQALRRFYLRPNIIWRTLRNCPGIVPKVNLCMRAVHAVTKMV